MGFFRKFKKTVSPEHRPALNVCLLQRRLERYSTARLNAAMQSAWQRAHEPGRFFAMNIDDEHGLIKFESMFIPIYFHDRSLGDEELDGIELPEWALHTAFCRISFSPGGEGLPTKQSRHQFTGFVALLALELANENTGAFFFVEDQAFIAASSLTRAMILERPTFDPHSAAVEQ